MQFRLVYRGPLRANGTVAQKYTIRRALHPQLKELWEHPPLDHFASAWLTRDEVDGDPFTVVETVGSFDFAPWGANTRLGRQWWSVKG